MLLTRTADSSILAMESELMVGMGKDHVNRKLLNRPYFFDEGLRFQCRRCGGCCTGEPGIVYADLDEVTAVAEYLKVTPDILKERFLNPFQDGFTIREAEDGRCIFYENGCVIYPVRPLQCKTFPFWFQNMRSRPAWKDACRRCPGIGQGRLYTREEILLTIQATYPLYLTVFEGVNR